MVHVQEPHWSQTSVGCDECVCVSLYECVCMCAFVSVCVYMCVYVTEIWGSFFPAAEQSLFWWIQRRKKTWKEDRICHMKQVLCWISSSFCVIIPSFSLRSHLVSSVGFGYFSVTISDWPATRCKFCLSVPALVHFLFPLLHSVLTVRLSFPNLSLSILTFILKQLFFPLS